MNPYAAPSPDSYGRDARPRVILWFRVYAAVMMLASLAMLGLALMGYEATRPEVAIEANAAGAPLVAVVLVLLSVALVALYGVATFVPLKPWGWTVGLAGGSVIFAVPLLVHWLRPQVKAAFARF
jgi:hypothetical protein